MLWQCPYNREFSLPVDTWLALPVVAAAAAAAALPSHGIDSAECTGKLVQATQTWVLHRSLVDCE
jgi:hypothetical protein